MNLEKNLTKILIIDYGSQFTQLIARRIRELGVYSRIISHNKIKLNDILNNNVGGLILSGGPLNVYQSNKIKFDKKILNLGIPILGICFGHQILSKNLGGKVKRSKFREFGLATIKRKNKSLITRNFFDSKNTSDVWMSHSDEVSKLPKGFSVIASTKNSKFAMIENYKKNRVMNRCQITGRPHGVYRKLKISRIALRKLGLEGKIPGMVKSSW